MRMSRRGGPGRGGWAAVLAGWPSLHIWRDQENGGEASNRMAEHRLDPRASGQHKRVRADGWAVWPGSPIAPAGGAGESIGRVARNEYMTLLARASPGLGRGVYWQYVSLGRRDRSRCSGQSGDPILRRAELWSRRRRRLRKGRHDAMPEPP